MAGHFPAQEEYAEPPLAAAIRLQTECMVRPPGAGLDDRLRFGATLLMNHTASGVPQVTTVLGLRATRINIEGMKSEIEAIGNTWDRMPWERVPFPAEDSAEAPTPVAVAGGTRSPAS